MTLVEYYQWVRDFIAIYVIVTGRTTPRIGTSDNVKMRRRLLQLATNHPDCDPFDAIDVLVTENILPA